VVAATEHRALAVLEILTLAVVVVVVANLAETELVAPVVVAL
jgi:hypothetical protein